MDCCNCAVVLLAVASVAGCGETAGVRSEHAPREAPRQLTAVRPASLSAEPAGSSTEYELSTGTVYYSGDPQRGHKPDGTFRRGTKVSLVHRAGAYSVVRSEDGLEAYVATHTLAPLATQ